MKAIIGGKRYDSSKAILIGRYCSPNYQTDFQYWEAALYCTKPSGKFFLAGHGGPMTRFARPVEGNSLGKGEKIIPMTPEEALAWAEQYLEPREIEMAFGEMLADA
jgi:hypothetical protein